LSQQKVGINAKPPAGAELLFDGSHEMLDEKCSEQNIIIYNSPDGKASLSLYAKDGRVWMNQYFTFQ